MFFLNQDSWFNYNCVDLINHLNFITFIRFKRIYKFNIVKRRYKTWGKNSEASIRTWKGYPWFNKYVFFILIIYVFYIYLFFQEIDTMKSDLALLKLQRQADHLKLGDLEVKMKHLEFENKKLKEGN